MDRRRFLTAATGLAAGSVLGCGGCGGSKGETVVKVISSLPRTGSAQGQTDTIVNGIKMAIDDAGGTVAGMRVVYEDMDDATASSGKWEAAAEAANARKAVADEDVMAFIGPYNSGAAKVSMPILNEGGVLQISPAATWPGLTKKVPGDATSKEPEVYRPANRVTFCRVCPTDDVQGPLSAEFAKDTLHAKKVYILHDNELYGDGIASLFEARRRAGKQSPGRLWISSSKSPSQRWTGLILVL
ncbi:ABC transporter substrate-binding protein [bacterium]|nr:ABC transporter substrate-binding protein [bacterium]